MNKYIRISGFVFSFLVFLVCLTACGNRAIPPEVIALHQKKPLPPINHKKKTIIVDAGHGGKDAGASSKKDDYEEKSLTLATALLVKNCLNQLGYEAVLTRNQDTFVPLSTRAEIANTLKAHLFVSIHYNYCSNPEAEGVEVFYYKEKTGTSMAPRIAESKKLGRQVLNRIVGQTGSESRGVKEANFAVIRETNMPAILVEAGFLSNPKEREKIKDTKYLRTLAWAIAKGIDHYVETAQN